MTVEQIHNTVRRHRAISRAALYSYFEALKIEPIGARQRPQRYPDDAADRIVRHLGFGKVVSMRTLRAERKKARRAA